MKGQKGVEQDIIKGEATCKVQGHRLLPYLTLILLFECWLTLHFLRQDPQFVRWFAYWQSKWSTGRAQSQLQNAFKNDPPLGLELTKIGLSNLSIDEPDEAILLIVFGNCEGCSAREVQGWVETLGNWETWRRAKVKGILVFQESKDVVRKAVKEDVWKIKVVSDERGQISKRLNAFFLPRAYGFVGGKLVWIQKKPNQGIMDTLESFLRVTKGKDKATKLINEWSAEMREKAWGNLPGFKGGEKK